MRQKVYQLRAIGTQVVFSEVIWQTYKKAEEMIPDFRRYCQEKHNLFDIVIDILTLELQ